MKNWCAGTFKEWYYFKRNYLSFNIYKNYEDIVKKGSDGYN